MYAANANNLSSRGWGLFHDVNPVEVLLVFAFRCYNLGSRDCWLSNLVAQNCPVVLFFLEIAHTRLFDSIRDADVDSGRRKRFMNLR
jgi:hypothetical protein